MGAEEENEGGKKRKKKAKGERDIEPFPRQYERSSFSDSCWLFLFSAEHMLRALPLSAPLLTFFFCSLLTLPLSFLFFLSLFPFFFLSLSPSLARL